MSRRNAYSRWPSQTSRYTHTTSISKASFPNECLSTLDASSLDGCTRCATAYLRDEDVFPMLFLGGTAELSKSKSYGGGFAPHLRPRYALAKLGDPSSFNRHSLGRRFYSEALLLKHLLDAPQRLPGSFFILNQRKAHVFIPVLTEADTRTDRNLSFGQHLLGKFERAHRFVSLRNRGPDKHR